MQRSDGRSDTDASTTAKGAKSATEKWLRVKGSRDLVFDLRTYEARGASQESSCIYTSILDNTPSMRLSIKQSSPLLFCWYYNTIARTLMFVLLYLFNFPEAVRKDPIVQGTWKLDFSETSELSTGIDRSGVLKASDTDDTMLLPKHLNKLILLGAFQGVVLAAPVDFLSFRTSKVNKIYSTCFEAALNHQQHSVTFKCCAMLRFLRWRDGTQRVGTAQLPSLAHVLMKIGIPRACTAKACASRGSGLGSTSRDRIPRGPVPPRPALTVYRGEAGQGGFFEMSGPDSVSRKSRTVGGVSYFGSDAKHEQNCRGCFILWKRCGTCATA
ncbi:hypothetical protein F2Q69_00004180 [Brassica cretica]|uniref:Uncharacterized protein n=1 Tax=Brassica cretica TaxID=69181 RepID=A0A8S9P8F5_BRACR|nr:hypothetical protein F2Q69_00004180 [Brassica cretica]